MILSMRTGGEWGLPLFPRSPQWVRGTSFDLAPLCLFPGQWWVSVGMDNLVSIYSMPTGAMVFQVPGRAGWGKWRSGG